MSFHERHLPRPVLFCLVTGLLLGSAACGGPRPPLATPAPSLPGDDPAAYEVSRAASNGVKTSRSIDGLSQPCGAVAGAATLDSVLGTFRPVQVRDSVAGLSLAGIGVTPRNDAKLELHRLATISSDIAVVRVRHIGSLRFNTPTGSAPTARDLDALGGHAYERFVPVVLDTVRVMRTHQPQPVCSYVGYFWVPASSDDAISTGHPDVEALSNAAGQGIALLQFSDYEKSQNSGSPVLAYVSSVAKTLSQKTHASYVSVRVVHFLQPDGHGGFASRELGQGMTEDAILNVAVSTSREQDRR